MKTYKEFLEESNSGERPYEAFYKNKRTTVYANSSYEAQLKAAKEFKAKKRYEVTVVLADVPVDTASL